MHYNSIQLDIQPLHKFHILVNTIVFSFNASVMIIHIRIYIYIYQILVKFKIFH